MLEDQSPGTARVFPPPVGTVKERKARKFRLGRMDDSYSRIFFLSKFTLGCWKTRLTRPINIITQISFKTSGGGVSLPPTDYFFRFQKFLGIQEIGSRPGRNKIIRVEKGNLKRKPLRIRKSKRNIQRQSCFAADEAGGAREITPGFLFLETTRIQAGRGRFVGFPIREFRHGGRRWV